MTSKPHVSACVLKAACFSPHAVRAISTDSLDARKSAAVFSPTESYDLAFLHFRFHFFPIDGSRTIFGAAVSYLQSFAIRSDVAVVSRYTFLGYQDGLVLAADVGPAARQAEDGRLRAVLAVDLFA